MPVAVVTDSTAYLPETLAAKPTIVPLTVVLGDRQGREGIDITAAEVASALTEGKIGVTTSRPAPAQFAEVYAALLHEGFTEVLSVHLSARLSGTVEAAAQAAASLNGRVRVVDSGSVAMGLGFPVIAALETAEAGGSLTEVARATQSAIERTTTLFCAGTLEYLRRGGRIGAAAALLGTALAVKPILRVAPGEAVAVSDRVRTTGRAIERLIELAVQAAGTSPVSVSVHHLSEPARARDVADRMAIRLGDQMRQCHVSEVGAVVGVHTGPGLLGIVVHRMEN